MAAVGIFGFGLRFTIRACLGTDIERQGVMVRITSRIAFGLVVLGFTMRAEAAFHLMVISEIGVCVGGDCRVQFVEFQMTAGGQNLVGGHDVYFLQLFINLLRRRW